MIFEVLEEQFVFIKYSNINQAQIILPFPPDFQVSGNRVRQPNLAEIAGRDWDILNIW